jgi:hypothetical protein
MEDRIFEPCVFKLLFQPIIQFRCFSFRYAKYKSIDRTMCEYNALYSVGYVEMRVTISYYHNSQSPYKTVLEQVTLAFPNRNDWHLGQHRLKKWIRKYYDVVALRNTTVHHVYCVQLSLRRTIPTWTTLG